MAEIVGSVIAFLFFGFFCFCACYGQYCKYWQGVYEKLGQPDVTSTKELDALWKQQNKE